MRIEEKRQVAAKPEELWTIVGDPVKLASWSDLFSVEPLSGEAPGVGTRYRALLQVGPVPVGGNIEIVTYDQGRDLAWTTITGVDHRMRVRLRPSDGGTQVTVRFAYDSPGIFGLVADLASFLAVRRAIRQVVDAVV